MINQENHIDNFISDINLLNPEDIDTSDLTKLSDGELIVTLKDSLDKMDQCFDNMVRIEKACIDRAEKSQSWIFIDAFTPHIMKFYDNTGLKIIKSFKQYKKEYFFERHPTFWRWFSIIAMFILFLVLPTICAVLCCI